MQTVSDLLAELLRRAAGELLDAESPPVEVQPASDARHGDYQSNLAFRLARTLRRPPRQAAEALAAALPAHPAVARLEVAGPGFLNFRLDDAWLARRLAEQLDHPSRGLPDDGAGRLVVVDYGSPNVAKRMHVGHLRSTVIGDAIVRLHRGLGWRVVGDNHIGDWGTQFGKLIVAYRRWSDPEAFARSPIEELERLYVLFGRKAEEEPELEELARAETARLQAGDPENRALWERFVAASMEEFERVYRRLGVRFDEVLGESAYHERLGPLVEDLLARGLAVEDQGAVVVPLEQDGIDVPLLVRKRDGAFLYGTTDLATLAYREERWDPDRVVYVTDTRQKLHFRQVFAAARRAGLTDAELVHVGFGVLRLPEGAMSSRKGNIVRLVELLDEAARRARAVVDAKSPELPEEERARIAELVGVAAVKYADLSQNPQSDVVFHWDRMLSLEGNTAPFLLYSYARCRSLQRKGGVERPSLDGLAVSEPLERELALALLRLPESARSALRAYRPNLLADALFGLAQAFNRFYQQLPVLRAPSPQREARLGLVEATARSLGTGLGLLGLPTLERM